MQESFDAALKRLKQRSELVAVERTFYAVPDTQANRVRRATDDVNSVRKIAHVPSAELQTALVNIVRDAHAIEADELTLRVARIFGWSRRGADIQAAIDTALAATRRNKTIVSSPEGTLSLGTPIA